MWVIDHIIPITNGGTNDISNLQIMHKTTNNIKGILSEDDFQLLINNIEQLPHNIKIYIIQRMTLNGNFK